jgi:excinuclease UvrABC nuclease subunit
MGKKWTVACFYSPETHPNRAGNYAIYAYSSLHRPKRLVYVGTSECIRQRMSGHRNDPCSPVWRCVNVDHCYVEMKYTLIDDDNTRLRQEARLIHRLNPILNTRGRKQAGH